jgi:hypothetical protein
MDKSSIQLPHPSSTYHKRNPTTSNMKNASILKPLLSHCHNINIWGKKPHHASIMRNAHKASNSKLDKLE